MLEDSGDVHLGAGTAFMMIIIALIIDALQAFLTFLIVGIIVNPLISMMAMMLFGIWFSHLGMSMMTPKNIGPFLGTIIGEFVPVINTLPLWTGFIIFTYSRNKMKEVL